MRDIHLVESEGNCLHQLPDIVFKDSAYGSDAEALGFCQFTWVNQHPLITESFIKGIKIEVWMFRVWERSDNRALNCRIEVGSEADGLHS